MNKQELDRYLSKFILVALSSEVIAQRLLTDDKIMIKEAVRNTKVIVGQSLDLVYAELIENFRDMELDNEFNHSDNPSFGNITSDEEWFDMISGLVDEIKEDLAV